jgi:predicted ribosomally synthesized peptide with nif11-like leader
MSIESCKKFLEKTHNDADLGRSLRAATDALEVLALGTKNGYSFNVMDLVAASSVVGASPQAEPEASAGVHDDAEPQTTILHHEVDLADIPELSGVLDELSNLTIKPRSVDLEAFHAAFRAEDLEWTTMSPAAPGFRDRYEAIMSSHWSGGEAERRDFHLLNLDQHVDDPLYESYFEAKTRTIGHLEGVFEAEIRFSGSMWYPPLSYRLWHTNETQPGWRMYLIDFDEDIPKDDVRSFFRYMNPHTHEVVTLRDRHKMLRFFKADQHEHRLFWHCIVNGAQRNRWSFGFVVPDDWLTHLERVASRRQAAAVTHEG